MAPNTVSKRYLGTGILKSDCENSDMQSKKISNDQEQSDPTKPFYLNRFEKQYVRILYSEIYCSHLRYQKNTDRMGAIDYSSMD